MCNVDTKVGAMILFLFVLSGSSEVCLHFCPKALVTELVLVSIIWKQITNSVILIIKI